MRHAAPSRVAGGASSEARATDGEFVEVLLGQEQVISKRVPSSSRKGDPVAGHVGGDAAVARALSGNKERFAGASWRPRCEVHASDCLGLFELELVALRDG